MHITDYGMLRCLPHPEGGVGTVRGADGATVYVFSEEDRVVRVDKVLALADGRVHIDPLQTFVIIVALLHSYTHRHTPNQSRQQTHAQLARW